MFTTLLGQFSALEREISKPSQLIPLKEKNMAQHNLLVLTVEENRKASWQYLKPYICLVLLWHQSHQPENFYMFLLYLFPPFCSNCQYLDQVFTLFCLDYCSRPPTGFASPVLSPLLSPLSFDLSICHSCFIGLTPQWLNAQLHSKIYL